MNVLLKFSDMEEPIFNAHNKSEWEQAHTCEHILNHTMVNMFGCPRSRNAHIERKKSKCDYLLSACPTDEQVAAIVDLSKLPDDVSETLRIVRVGNYDDCACIGSHVKNTSEIGSFRIISHDFNDGVWRVRWKVTQP